MTNNLPLLEKLDIKVDLAEALEYYHQLEKNYQQYKWEYKNYNPGASDKSYYGKMFGWSMNSNNGSFNEPNMDGNGNNFKETPCAFGFGKKVMNFFEGANYVCVSVVPPNTRLKLHTDDDRYKRIHIPLTTDDKFFFYDQHRTRFKLEAGSVYILHTDKLHGAKHSGINFRAHLMVKYATRSIDEIYNKAGKAI